MEREKLEELGLFVCLFHAKQYQNEVQPIHRRQRELEVLILRKYGTGETSSGRILKSLSVGDGKATEEISKQIWLL